jgi:hypothetical protein
MSSSVTLEPVFMTRRSAALVIICKPRISQDVDDALCGYATIEHHLHFSLKPFCLPKKKKETQSGTMCQV